MKNAVIKERNIIDEEERRRNILKIKGTYIFLETDHVTSGRGTNQL